MKQKRVAIVGAGATGLSAALWLHDHSDLQYDVYEASNQVGGKIVTYKDRGFVIEGGADSYLERKASMTHFIQRVGLGDSLVRNEVGQSYILKSGTLFPTPKNTVLGIPTDIDAFLETKLISDEGKRNLLKEYEKPRFAKPGEDVSAGAFFEYRLGKEMVDSLIEPLLGGIYGGNIYELSMKAIFPHFLQYEAEYGSLLKGVAGTKSTSKQAKKQGMFLTVKSGLASVLEAAAEQLRPGSVHLNAAVERIDVLDDGAFTVFVNGTQKRYDAVIVTIPPQQAAKLFVEINPFSDIGSIEATSCATVAMIFPEGAVDNEHEGTGFVVARGGDETITACTWTDLKWPHTSPSRETLLRAYVGRPGEEAIVEANDQTIVNAVLADLQNIMAIRTRPTFYRVTRWKKAMPQYQVGHLQRIERFKKACAKHPGLYVTGAYFGGVGVPDCIDQGQACAKQLMNETT